MSSTEARPVIATPAGVRDMLPQEMAEVADVVRPFRHELESAGFGEMHTPALEFESVMALGDVESTEPAFRLIDEMGRTLVLRSDMTIPVARVVATRLREDDPPFRLYYVSHVYRGQPSRAGHPREFLQIGAELMGRPGTSGTLELLGPLVRSLASIQLERYSILLGDTTLFPRLLEGLAVSEPTRSELLHELVTRDLAGFRRIVETAHEQGVMSESAAALIQEAAHTRGNLSLFKDLDPRLRGVGETLETLLRSADEDIRRHVIVDFALVRKLGYYTGEVFEIHHPGIGEPLGGGGRYDGLLARFGRPLAATGFGLTVERLHEALRADDDLLKNELRTGRAPPAI